MLLIQRHILGLAYFNSNYKMIAADINNFLYDSGGDPNAIPVVSLFHQSFFNKLVE